MSRLWGNVWSRSLAVWIYAGVMAAIGGLVPRAVLPLLATIGLLDFAGGAVLHANIWATLMSFVPPWAVVEIVFWRRRTTPPLKLYLAFVALYFLALPALTLIGIGVWFHLDLGYRLPAIWLMLTAWFLSTLVAAVGAALVLKLWPVHQALPQPQQHF